MAKTGRPRKEWDQEHFEKLCALQCTAVEIASFFDFSVDTLDTRCKEDYGLSFSECRIKYASEGKMSLRRTQFRLAEKSAAMAIFLGKNVLEQVDTPLVDQSTHYHVNLADKLKRARERVENESVDRNASAAS